MIRRYFKQMLLLCFMLCITWRVSVAQDIRIDEAVSISTCAGNFFDTGGALSGYLSNENFSMTICSDGSTGSHIKLLFRELDLAVEDQLCIFDGTTINDPLLACATDFSTMINEEVIGVSAREPIAIQASIENASGCLTISFNSNGGSQREGWRAEISCIPACQPIEALIVDSDPAIQPMDTGWIDACIGQRIFLNADGMFPQEGQFYNHRDSSEYIWNFGDGTVKYGKNVDHTYMESGGYNVQLQIQDQLGCVNSNFAGQRVRIAPKPDFQVQNDLAAICSGDTITLNAGINDFSADNIISVLPKEGEFLAQRIRADSLPLPDGTGESYSTSVRFTGFDAGQVLEDVNDLRSICLNMEHSYMRDLEIRLSCPNGQSIILHDYPGRTGARTILLGEPIDNDGEIIRPGVGYDYCWTPNATNGTWIEYAINNTSISTLPSSNYNSFDPMEDLLGCPLNGEWTISVEDLWAFDNGFIFSWGIEFDPTVYPDLETFTPQIVDFAWDDNPSVVTTTTETLTASPINAGQAAYTFTVLDEFGCYSDTSVVIDVLPPTHPDCYDCQSFLMPIADTTLCEGESVQLDAGPNFDFKEVGFAAFPMYDELGFPNHPPGEGYESSIEVTDVYPGILTNPEEEIVAVCIDIETAATDWVSDLNIYLRTPSGSLLPLSRGNGLDGSNYTNTCFTPSATTRIQDGEAPFTGDFQPEGNWGNLVGVSSNGTWTLLVDDANGPQLGTFNSWSITFNSRNTISYNWTPVEGLSCADCPNPTAQPSNTATYTVETSDIFNCTYSQDITIGSASDYIAPAINCGITDIRQLTFNWDDPSNIGRYEIRIDGSDWENTNNGNLSHILNGLEVNQEVIIEIRPFIPNSPANCTIETVSSSCIYDACGLNIITTAPPDTVSCSGVEDGLISFSLEEVALPASLTVDATTPVNITDTFITIENLAAGNHQVIVSDANDCTDTLNFTIFSPPALALTATTQNVSCKSGSDGGIDIIPTGGTGALQTNWENGTTGNQNRNLSVGTYGVTVSDELNCQFDTTFTITEPDSLLVTLDLTAASCSNTIDGTAAAIATGGTGNVTYQWNNNATTATLSSLPPGIYAVTVTDENGCTNSASSEIISPDPLIVRELTIQNVDCFGNSTGRAVVEVSGGTMPYEYLWNDPLGQTSETAMLLSIGDYEVQITDQNNCVTTASVIITQPDPLELSVDWTDVNCFDSTDGTAIANATGGTAPYQYQWNDNLNQTTRTALGLNAGVYNASVTDANNCKIDTIFEIQQPIAPITGRIEQTFIGCHAAAESEARIIVEGGTGSNYAFEWSNGQTSATATNLDTISYKVIVRDENSCVDTFAIEKIEDHPPISININGNKPSCFGYADGVTAVTRVEGGTGTGYQFEWNTTPISTTQLVSGVMGGRDYTVTVTDDQGCVGIKTRALDQPSPIVITTDSTDVICYGERSGAASIIDITGGNGTYQYQWSTDTLNDTTAVLTNLPVGSYEVTVTDEKGCFTSKTVQVVQPEELQLTHEMQATTCNGSADGAIKIAINGGIPSYQLLWSTNALNSKIDGLTAGTYTITVTDANNCELVEAIDVTQPDPIDINISQLPITCAGGRDGGIEINAAGGTVPYAYSIDNKNFRGSPTFLGLSANAYDVFIKDRNGCESFTSIQLQDPPAFEVTIQPTQQIVELNKGENIQLFAEATNAIGKVEFVWSPSYIDTIMTISCTECFNPTVSPNATISYELYGVDEGGCEATDIIQIRVSKNRTILVPTGFTPNGDNLNNKLLVHGTQGTVIKTFRVFDRLGELVYEATDFPVNNDATGWDGTFRGSELPSGVYVWYLEAEFDDSRTEIFKGSTMLIR